MKVITDKITIIGRFLKRKVKLPRKNIETRTVYYDREKAKMYAEKYALEPNTREYPYYETDDCTNFISQVLKAGGLKEEGSSWNNYNSWFCKTTDSSNKGLTQVAITWRAARYFRKHWGNENGVGRNRARVYEIIPVSVALQNFNDIYNSVDIGDVIQHIDTRKGNHPYHTQIIHKKRINSLTRQPDLLMAQHTANRKDVSLYSYLEILDSKEKRYICIYRM